MKKLINRFFGEITVACAIGCVVCMSIGVVINELNLAIASMLLLFVPLALLAVMEG